MPLHDPLRADGIARAGRGFGLRHFSIYYCDYYNGNHVELILITFNMRPSVVTAGVV